jgi:transposase
VRLAAALRARKPPKVVAVALANKLAQIVWAITTAGEVFRQVGEPATLGAAR